jgi:hypothetical protein
VISTCEALRLESAFQLSNYKFISDLENAISRSAGGGRSQT